MQITPRKGVTVADYAVTGNLDTLLSIMQYQGGNLDKKTTESLFAFRSYMECPAMKILAKHHTKEQMLQLEESLDEVRSLIDEDIESFSKAIYYYHRMILFLSGNSITPLIMNAFEPAIMPFWMNYVQELGKENALKRLEDFTRYIRQGDGSLATALLCEGLQVEEP